MIKINETDTYKKDWEKLDKSIREQIEKRVDKLKEDPRSGNPQKYIQGLWALHVGKYRIFYTITEEKTIDLLFIYLLTILHKKKLDGNYQPIFQELDKIIKKLKEIKPE